jgi:TonB-dependent SusC/RagA subfamily outer membrane receptor
LFFILSGSGSGLLGQTRTLSGTVVCFNKIPVAGVQIKSAKAKDQTFTDRHGNFTIEVRSKSDRLKLKAKGFKSMAYRVGRDRDSVRVNMVYYESTRNNEMVTAYGHITQDDLTFALSNLKDDNNSFSNYKDVFEILSTFSGVRINRSINPPGVNIRNASSIMLDTQPLFIVDGMPTDRDFVANIEPVTIKEISVLKDAAASIYGSRGANGVILIELKGH